MVELVFYCQVRVHGPPSSFSFQMCLLSSVCLLFTLWLKLALCVTYVALKDVAVSPIFSPSVVAVTVLYLYFDKNV